MFAPDGEAAADLAEQIRRVEGRAVIHPYEGVQVSEATGTIALEIAQQVPDLDAIVLSVGGGGLCSGVSSTMKQLRPECRIYGVEPEGADTMYRSFRSGHVESLDSVATIADCLAPPRTLPYSFGLCRQFVDKLVLIDDDRIVGAMKTLFADLKIAAEPGGAASTAAALGPLRDRLAGKKSLILLCGSNIDLDTFTSILSP